jgi:hypothetical protein
MSENLGEIPLKTGIIDYGTPINGGVPIYINLTIYDFSFEASYWIHPNGNTLLECDPRFLKLWGVEETSKLPFYKELCQDIETILPNKEDIFNEILK